MASWGTLRKSQSVRGRVVRRFWPYMREQRLLVAGSMLALFAEIGLRLLEPWPLKLVFDRVIPTRAAGGHSVPFVDHVSPSTLALLAAFALVAILGLRALASYCNTVGFALVGNRVVTRVRADLFRHCQYLSLSFYNKARIGDLVVRVVSDMGMLRDVAITAFLPLMASVLVLLVLLVVMVWLNWQLALVAIAGAPLFWLSTVRLSRRIQEVSRKQRRREGAMAATAAESMGAMKAVQALSLEERFGQDFLVQSDKSLKEGVHGSRLSARLERTVDVFIAVSTALSLWYGTRLVVRSDLTPGDLIVFLAYLKTAFKPLQDFAKYTGRVAKATAAAERVLDLLERVPEVRDLPGARPAPVFKGEVKFEHVSFGYEPGQRVLDDIDFSVGPGQRVALVGPSGSGKSTLASLLLRLYDPIQGCVLIDGHDMREYTIESVRAQMSIVLQDTFLFAATVRDNIAYGAPDAAFDEVQAAARLANAADFIEALPGGYGTVLGERGVTLSNGQCQRIAIARAALRKAPILILDEPTTGLDEANKRQVIEALANLSRGRTVFLITHELELASRCDVILYIEDGRLLEFGTHDELTSLNGRYAALYALQSGSGNHAAEKEASIAFNS